MEADAQRLGERRAATDRIRGTPLPARPLDLKLALRLPNGTPKEEANNCCKCIGEYFGNLHRRSNDEIADGHGDHQSDDC